MNTPLETATFMAKQYSSLDVAINMAHHHAMQYFGGNQKGYKYWQDVKQELNQMKNVRRKS